MDFAVTGEQRAFTDSLHSLLTDAGAVGVARAWADGDTGPGLALWRRLAEVGVTALAVPEESGGLGAAPIDWVLACEELGHHAVPGPVAETVAVAPALLGDMPPGLVAIAMPPLTPHAVDAHAAALVLHVEDGKIRRGRPTSPLLSVDRGRTLSVVEAAESLGESLEPERAADAGALACAAQLLGAGRALLETTADYARRRTQFGRPIGSFQAVQHHLANALVGLEFARPLLWRAALSFASAPAAADVSAAKVACAEAADRAARVALQVHGAIGYTLECDVGVWFARVRALIPAWGTPSWHRARIAGHLRSLP